MEVVTARQQEKLLHSERVRKILTSGALVSPSVRASSNFILPISRVEVNARCASAYHHIKHASFLAQN
jgi:hypothetical protein